MEDPEPAPAHEHDDEAEQRRRAAEAMEQMLLAQEGEDENNEDDNEDLHQDQEEEEEEEDPFILRNRNMIEENNIGVRKSSFSYIRSSFMAAIALIYYALRTREQWYLALVFLGSSKWAYVVLGNALIASLIWSFQVFTGLFLNGLRLAEAEGIGDFFRWNITETCIALTMFRSELNVKTMILFLILVLAKCLHWVADLREGHLRMTEESVVTNPTSQWPFIRWQHFKLLCCLGLLQLLDIFAVFYCLVDIYQNGPSVFILFAFEGAILLVSVISNILLWHVHVLDGFFHHWHETLDSSRAMHRWIHPWKDHKATLIFAVEVQAQAARFLFYVSFFGIVMTYYGMPINLFREVYVSFQSLRQRLVAFNKYRQLMASMYLFKNPTQEELEEEHTCIICRDEMTVETTKKLPGCGHLFHKSCLREWLVQQQSCPTCRGDIYALQARQRQQDLADERQRQEQEQQEQDNAPDQAGQQQQQQQQQGQEEYSRLDPADGIEQEQESYNVSGGVGNILPDETGDDVVDANDDVIRKKRLARLTEYSSSPLPDNNSREKMMTVLPAFPAFYRVIQDEGAIVYRLQDDSLEDSIVRIVPFGVIILGQGLDRKLCNNEQQMMVKMPDGWLLEDSVERIVAIPFEDGDKAY